MPSVVKHHIMCQTCSSVDNLLANYLSRWHLDQRYGIQFLELTKDWMLKEKVVTDNLFSFTLLKSDLCL